MIKSDILLEGTNGKINVFGKQVKAVGMYSHETASILNTIAIYTTKFVGRIHLYGTLETDPTPLDWAELKISDEKCITPFIEMNNEFDKELHRNIMANVEGAYTYLRVDIDRSYLPYVNNEMLSEDELNDGRVEQLLNARKLNQDCSMYKESILNRVGAVNRIVLSY